MSDTTVYLRPVHRINQRVVAFLIFLANVVMARRSGEEQPLADRQIFIRQGKAELGSAATGGFVRFVEDGQIERLLLTIHTSEHSFCHDVRRLVRSCLLYT